MASSTITSSKQPPNDYLGAIRCINDTLKRLQAQYTIDCWDRALMLIGEEAKQRIVARRGRWKEIHAARRVFTSEDFD